MLLFPKVSPQIFVSPRNQTVSEGKTAVLICKATGFSKPAITWTFNDRSLPSLAIEKHTEEGYQLLLQNVSKYMEGIYKCTAKNKARSASSTSSLRILGKCIKINKNKNNYGHEEKNSHQYIICFLSKMRNSLYVMKSIVLIFQMTYAHFYVSSFQYLLGQKHSSHYSVEFCFWSWQLIQLCTPQNFTLAPPELSLGSTINFSFCP